VRKLLQEADNSWQDRAYYVGNEVKQMFRRRAHISKHNIDIIKNQQKQKENTFFKPNVRFSLVLKDIVKQDL